MKGMDLIKELFKDEGTKFFSDLSEADPKVVVPRGRVVNLLVTIHAQNELLIRHEGGEDVSLASIGNEKYPIILNEKVQSAWRRNLLKILRRDYDKHKQEIDKIRGNGNDDWECMIRPTVSAKGKDEKTKEEKMGGLCRECPSCMTFGFAVAENADYNLKSRVQGDLFISTTPEQKSVVVRTFNAIDDVTKTTFIEAGGTRTGSLFRLSLVKENTVFVGKVSLNDVSPAEFALLTLSLATTTKIGGNTTDFGNVSISIPAVVLSPYEVSSGLDLFKVTKGTENVEEIHAKIKERANQYNEKEGIAYVFDDLGKTITEKLTKNGEIDHEIVEEAWRNGIALRQSIEKFINKDKGKKKSEKEEE